MKYVCARCGVSCGWWAKGDDGYWKHQNGGYKGPKTCGQPASPVRVTELAFSPAMRSALLEVRQRLAGGAARQDALRVVADRRGFGMDELRDAFNVSLDE